MVAVVGNGHYIEECFLSYGVSTSRVEGANSELAVIYIYSWYFYIYYCSVLLRSYYSGQKTMTKHNRYSPNGPSFIVCWFPKRLPSNEVSRIRKFSNGSDIRYKHLKSIVCDGFNNRVTSFGLRLVSDCGYI